MPIFELYFYIGLAPILLAILFAYRSGQQAVPGSGQSLTWTHVPLIAYAIVSFGPSAFAIVLYLGYKFGLIQPKPSGYQFSTFILSEPFDFAVINWGFVALYLTCRLRPNLGSAKSAMWFSLVAMSIPNIALFSLAWEMVSNVRDAGQGIGIILATITFPIITMIWPDLFASVFDDNFSIAFAISALTGPLPLLGLIGWLVGQLMGWTASSFSRKTTAQS